MFSNYISNFYMATSVERTKRKYFPLFSSIAKTPAIYYLSDKQVAQMYPTYAQMYEDADRQQLIKQNGRWVDNKQPTARQLVSKGYDKQEFDFIRYYITETINSVSKPQQIKQDARKRLALVNQIERQVQQLRPIIMRQYHQAEERQLNRILRAREKQGAKTPKPKTPGRSPPGRPQKRPLQPQTQTPTKNARRRIQNWSQGQIRNPMGRQPPKFQLDPERQGPRIVTNQQFHRFNPYLQGLLTP
jgi:hypothetical protein